MACAATLLVAAAILFLAPLVVFGVISRGIPEDQESEIEVRFGPATIRRRLGPPSATTHAPPTERDG
jgi:hypothetical protein